MANRLLRAGIRVYLYPGMTHVKAVVVDGVWAYLGTGNLDPLSLRHNYELGLAISDGPVIADLEQRLFVEDMRPETELMRPLPARELCLERRWVLRVPPDPHLRFDTNDYSLDPNLVGRRVEVRVSQREVMAVALDTGELACRHERSFAKNRTITALEHARALRERRGQRDEVVVERRPLSVYDQLIA